MRDMVAAVFEFGGIGILGVFSLKRLRYAACKPEHVMGVQVIECHKGMSGGVLENHRFVHSQSVGIVGAGLGDVSRQRGFYRFICAHFQL